jgi:hypothetical protein
MAMAKQWESVGGRNGEPGSADGEIDSDPEEEEP